MSCLAVCSDSGWDISVHWLHSNQVRGASSLLSHHHSKPKLQKKANKLIQAVELGGQLHADRLTSSHHCRPLNDRTRVRTALRHPLFNGGSEGAGEEIGHLVMMSFVKNADTGFGRDWAQTHSRHTHQHYISWHTHIPAHTYPHTHTDTLFHICSWLQQV